MARDEDARGALFPSYVIELVLQPLTPCCHLSHNMITLTAVFDVRVHLAVGVGVLGAATPLSILYSLVKAEELVTLRTTGLHLRSAVLVG